MEQVTEATAATPFLVASHLLAAAAAVMDLVDQAQAPQEMERLADQAVAVAVVVHPAVLRQVDKVMLEAIQTQTHQAEVAAVELVLPVQLHRGRQVVLAATELHPPFPDHR